MSTVGTPISELIILRDDNNVPLLQVLAADLDVLEAYLLASPATTAVVSLVEIGNGEYRASFTPTVAGTWVLHAIYGDGTLFDFREYERRYEVAEVSTAPTAVAVAIGAAYLTVDEFRARSRSTTTANDDAIAAVLQSASRQIDGHCGRTFGHSAAPETRTFDAWNGHRGDPGRWNGYDYTPCLEIGDVVSVVSIASGDGTGAYPTIWDADAYALLPRNAAAKGFPYTEIGPPVGRWSGWPLTSYGLQIVGIFGWPAVPAPVKEVCFLTANRLKSLWDSPFGVSGGGEMGSLNMTGALSPIMKEMLKPFVVRVV